MKCIPLKYIVSSQGFLKIKYKSVNIQKGWHTHTQVLISGAYGWAKTWSLNQIDLINSVGEALSPIFITSGSKYAVLFQSVFSFYIHPSKVLLQRILSKRQKLFKSWKPEAQTITFNNSHLSMSIFQIYYKKIMLKETHSNDTYLVSTAMLRDSSTRLLGLK